DKNFTIPNAPHPGGPSDGFNHPVGLVGSYNNLDLYLRHEEHRVLGAPIDLGVTALPAEALHVRDRHALDTQTAQGLTNFLKLEGFDDGAHEFHVLCLCAPRAGWRTMVQGAAELKVPSQGLAYTGLARERRSTGADAT